MGIASGERFVEVGKCDIVCISSDGSYSDDSISDPVRFSKGIYIYIHVCPPTNK